MNAVRVEGGGVPEGDGTGRGVSMIEAGRTAGLDAPRDVGLAGEGAHGLAFFMHSGMVVWRCAAALFCGAR